MDSNLLSNVTVHVIFVNFSNFKIPNDVSSNSNSQKYNFEWMHKFLTMHVAQMHGREQSSLLSVCLSHPCLTLGEPYRIANIQSKEKIERYGYSSTWQRIQLHKQNAIIYVKKAHRNWHWWEQIEHSQTLFWKPLVDATHTAFTHTHTLHKYAWSDGYSTIVYTTSSLPDQK